MANYNATILQAIYDWITKELGITTIFQDQYKVRPQKSPYAVIGTSVIGTYGARDESAEVDNNGLCDIDGHRRMLVMLQIVGKGAVELMTQLQASLSKVTVLDALWNNSGIAVLDKGDITDITRLLETEGLEQAAMDVRIGFAVQYEENQGLIEQVEINGEIVPIVQT